MNKPLVERIDALRWRITNQRELSELDSILADVRELVEAVKLLEFGTSGICKDCNGWYVGPHGVTRNVHTKDCRISAVLRKVGGDIRTAPSLPAVESQNSAVKVPDDVMVAAERLALAEQAIEVAHRIIGTCGGDAWERECTESDRNEFARLDELLYPTARSIAAPVDPWGWKMVPTDCPECNRTFKNEISCQQHRRDRHGIDFNGHRPSYIQSLTHPTEPAR